MHHTVYDRSPQATHAYPATDLCIAERRELADELCLPRRREYQRAQSWLFPLALFGPGPMAAICHLAEVEARTLRRIAYAPQMRKWGDDWGEMLAAYLTDDQRPWTPINDVVDVMCEAGNISPTTARHYVSKMWAFSILRAGYWYGRPGYTQLGATGYDLLELLEAGA